MTREELAAIRTRAALPVVLPVTRERAWIQGTGAATVARTIAVLDDAALREAGLLLARMAQDRLDLLAEVDRLQRALEPARAWCTYWNRLNCWEADRHNPHIVDPSTEPSTPRDPSGSGHAMAEEAMDGWDAWLPERPWCP